MNRLHRGKLLVKLASDQQSTPNILDEATGEFRPITESQDIFLQSDGSDNEERIFDNSSSDSDYHPYNSDSTTDDLNTGMADEIIYDDILDESTGQITRVYKDNGRKRKHRSKGKADRSEWKRQKAQQARLKGEAYEGFQKDENGKYKQTLLRPAKSLQPGCRGHVDIQEEQPQPKGGPKQNFKCKDLTEEMRRAIFQEFWLVSSWEARKVYVRSLITVQDPQHRRHSTTDATKKKKSFKYFLKHTSENGETKTVHVCKTMFASTLGIGARQLRSWIEMTSNEDAQESEPRQARNIVISPNSIIEFLDSLPKMESHYCRASSRKKYLESTWDSVTGDLFDEYLNFCSMNEKQAYCKSSFSKTFHKLDYAIFKPRKDQCNKCLAFKNKNLSQDEYDKHQAKKVKARDEKSRDKEQSNDQTIVFTMDVQAVMLCPRIQASATYYKTKLKVHNSTHYDLKTGAAICFLWHEGNGGLESDIFASILIRHLTEQTKRDKPNKIIIWSDGCCYQNRSVVLANTLLEFAITEDVVIEQKYLEVGHTQMEVDTMHSTIERKLPSHREIFVPADYIKIIRSARRTPEPYNVEFLHFKDFFKHIGGRYSSIRPGNKKGDPCVTDICALQYLPEGKIKYKVDFDQEYEYLPRRPTGNQVTTAPLYDAPLPIDATKYQHLQEMKHLMPRDYHPFYDNLEHSCNEQTCPHRREF